MELSPMILSLTPRISGVWNFYSELLVGKNNKVLETSLGQLAIKLNIDKSDLQNFLENFNEEELNQEELEVVNDFFCILYENMLKDPDLSPKLVGERLRAFELMLKEITSLVSPGQEANDPETLCDTVKCVLVVGSAYAEHTLQLTKDMMLGEKQSAIVNDFYGGSGINYTLRLIEMGIATIPILPIGTDTFTDIKDILITSGKKTKLPKPILEFISSKEFSCGIPKTPHSYILIERDKERRTIFGEEIYGLDCFKAHIGKQIDKIYEGPKLGIEALVIGHIPEPESELHNAAQCTRYLINRFRDKSFIFTNFGDSQIRLGVDFWENDLKNVDIFQLNLSEIRNFFSKKYGKISLYEIIKWLQEHKITSVITLDRFGAIGTYKKGKEGILLAWPFNLESYVDSTGAGDALGAGLVFKLYDKPSFSFEEFYGALKEARIWAAHSCTTLGGASNPPDRDALQYFSNDLLEGEAPIVEIKRLEESEPILRIFDKVY